MFKIKVPPVIELYTDAVVPAPASEYQTVG